MRELRAAPPKVFIVERGDIFPVVTGNHEDSVTALRSFARLQQLVDEQYEYRERIQDFELYVRR